VHQTGAVPTDTLVLSRTPVMMIISDLPISVRQLAQLTVSPVIYTHQHGNWYKMYLKVSPERRHATGDLGAMWPKGNQIGIAVNANEHDRMPKTVKVR